MSITFTRILYTVLPINVVRNWAVLKYKVRHNIRERIHFNTNQGFCVRSYHAVFNTLFCPNIIYLANAEHAFSWLLYCFTLFLWRSTNEIQSIINCVPNLRSKFPLTFPLGFVCAKDKRDLLPRVAARFIARLHFAFVNGGLMLTWKFLNCYQLKNRINYQFNVHNIQHKLTIKQMCSYRQELKNKNLFIQLFSFMR